MKSSATNEENQKQHKNKTCEKSYCTQTIRQYINKTTNMNAKFGSTCDMCLGWRYLSVRKKKNNTKQHLSSGMIIFFSRSFTCLLSDGNSDILMDFNRLSTYEL